MPVQVTKIENKTTNSGQNYKYIELSNGVKGSMWATSGMGAAKHDTVGYAEIQVGQSGDAEITSTEKNGKTYQNIISWVPSERPPSAGGSTNGSGPDWDAKDRGKSMGAIHHGAVGNVVAAAITAGIVKDAAGILTLFETLSVSAYALGMQATKGTLVYPGMDPVEAPDPWADE